MSIAALRLSGSSERTRQKSPPEKRPSRDERVKIGWTRVEAPKSRNDIEPEPEDLCEFVRGGEAFHGLAPVSWRHRLRQPCLGGCVVP
jgi:hypothetical protein